MRKTSGIDTWAHRLRQARLRKGFKTGKAAAVAFGWNYTTYSQHERLGGVSGRGLRQDTAEKYARAFGVSVAWLLTGEGEPAWISDPAATRPKREKAVELLPSVLRQAVCVLLTLEGHSPEASRELSDIFVECLIAPTIASLDHDPIKSFQVHLELRSAKSSDPVTQEKH